MVVPECLGTVFIVLLYPAVSDGRHRSLILDRDVSLENLLLDEGNRVKLIDFGLALRIPQTADGRARVLRPQGAGGKQNYISPEVLLNSGGFDGFAVDVWACGILFFV